MRKEFRKQIAILRILDSRREGFKLSKAYRNKIAVIDIITAPEIEMLIIVSEDQFDQFKKSGKKPSEFCKSDLRFNNVKSYSFVKQYFSDVDSLVTSIMIYNKKTKQRKGEYTLKDLLK